MTRCCLPSRLPSPLNTSHSIDIIIIEAQINLHLRGLRHRKSYDELRRAFEELRLPAWTTSKYYRPGGDEEGR